jgi:hypothetical protein
MPVAPRPARFASVGRAERRQTSLEEKRLSRRPELPLSVLLSKENSYNLLRIRFELNLAEQATNAPISMIDAFVVGSLSRMIEVLESDHKRRSLQEDMCHSGYGVRGVSNG